MCSCKLTHSKLLFLLSSPPSPSPPTKQRTKRQQYMYEYMKAYRAAHPEKFYGGGFYEHGLRRPFLSTLPDGTPLFSKEELIDIVAQLEYRVSRFMVVPKHITQNMLGCVSPQERDILEQLQLYRRRLKHPRSTTIPRASRFRYGTFTRYFKDTYNVTLSQVGKDDTYVYYEVPLGITLTPEDATSFADRTCTYTTQNKDFLCYRVKHYLNISRSYASQAEYQRRYQVNRYHANKVLQTQKAGTAPTSFSGGNFWTTLEGDYDLGDGTWTAYGENFARFQGIGRWLSILLIGVLARGSLDTMTRPLYRDDESPDEPSAKRRELYEHIKRFYLTGQLPFIDEIWKQALKHYDPVTGTIGDIPPLIMRQSLEYLEPNLAVCYNPSPSTYPYENK